LPESRADHVVVRNVSKAIELTILSLIGTSFASAASSRFSPVDEPSTEAALAFIPGLSSERRAGCISFAGCVFVMNDEPTYMRHS
jgi:hypothetical protein